mgnify:FL=1
MPDTSKTKLSLKKPIIFIELVLLLIGVSLPLATIDEFWFFSSEFSVISLTYVLAVNQEYTLAAIIILFGFIFPLIKIFQKTFISNYFASLPLYKFSMLDIFLLSFLVFGGKLSYFYDVQLKVGFYCMLLSVALSYIPIITFKRSPR